MIKILSIGDVLLTIGIIIGLVVIVPRCVGQYNDNHNCKAQYNRLQACLEHEECKLTSSELRALKRNKEKCND